MVSQKVETQKTRLMPSTPTVAVVILSWNGLDFLKKFIPPLVERTTYSNAELYVADNCSTDDSIAWLKSEAPSVKIIQNKDNRGFAGGYNLALSQIETDFYVLLNQDVEVTKGWLEKVMAQVANQPEVGAVQPKILAYHEREKFEYAGAAGGFIDRFGYPFCRGRIFYETETDEGLYDEDIETFWATGACLIVRSDLYHACGGLDERFFAHMEEIDLCWRIQNAGYKVITVCESIVYHVGGGSLPQGNPRKVFLNFRNNLAMMYKNLPLGEMLFKVATRLILDGLAAARFIMIREWSGIGAILKAHFSFYSNLGYWTKQRKVVKSKRPMKDLSGYYAGSITWQFFGKGIKHFSNLPGIQKKLWVKRT